MINLIQLLIIPVVGTPELSWIVREKELLQVLGDPASFI
jgi:hypothetical protein